MGHKLVPCVYRMPHYFDGTQMIALCIENATLLWWDTN